jgi:hypothetical protein
VNWVSAIARHPRPCRYANALTARQTDTRLCLLILPGRRSAFSVPPGDTRPALPPAAAAAVLTARTRDIREGDDPLRRRTFVGLTGASLFGAAIGSVPRPRPPIDVAPLASALAGGAAAESSGLPPDIAALTTAVNTARRDYQDCRYKTLIGYLPRLLGRLAAAFGQLDGDDRLEACVLSADAEHRRRAAPQAG